MKEQFDGEFAPIGFLMGLAIGLIEENLVFGIFLGLIIGIALDWLGNLILLWKKNHPS